MFCRNCGKPVKDGASFCGSCGEPIPKKPETASVPSAPAAPPEPQASAAPPAPPPQNPQPPYQAPQNPQSRFPRQPAQQQYPQGSTPVYAAAQRPPQTNIGLIAIIILLAALVLAAAVLLFIKPGYLLHRGGGNVSSLAEQLETGLTAPAQTETQAGTAGSETSAAETVTQAQTEPPVQEPADESSTEESSDSSSDGSSENRNDSSKPEEARIGGENKPLNDAWAASTSARPSFDEFEWCFGQNGFIYDAPGYAEPITAPDGWIGGWKAMVIYNPTNAAGTFTRELDNIVISVEGTSAELTIDWYLMAADYGESYNEEDMPDTVFYGTATRNGLSVSGAATIQISSFWNDGGKQYAVGTLTTQDGIPAYLAMVRP